MSYEANIRRALLNRLKVSAASWTPATTVKDADIRQPFNPAEEDEAVIFRFVAVRRPPARENVWEGLVAAEVHCMTKRGDLRNDKRTDRHMILASLVQTALRDDITVTDAVGGNTNLVIGVIGGVRTETHLRDKRNTIFGADVDYSVETPNTLQAVVSLTAYFCTNIS